MRTSTRTKRYIILKPLFISLVVSLIIMTVWFSEGLLFATAEEGMPFYSLTRSTSMFQSVWLRWGTGFVYSVGLPLAFSAKLLSLMNLFLNNVQIQAIAFFLLIFSGIYGTYLLTQRVTRNDLMSLFAGLFYFLNLYSMSQVWRR